tara:strand:+ start:124 stop:312 length:189 start_codon:yes stop_codon:yes gene_type:complete
MVAKSILELLDNKPNANQFDFLNKKGTPPVIERVCPESHHQEETGGKLPDDAPRNESSLSQQ